jgi:hypothetical protein
MEMAGTLEWCHFQGAGSFRNLVWWELFNRFLPDHPPSTQDQWMKWLISELQGKYTEGTLSKHLHQEVRFIVDAYIDRKFQKLELLHPSTDGTIYVRRYAHPNPKVFASLVYQFASETQSRLFQMADLTSKPGSPGRVFAMDDSTLRGAISALHSQGWVRHEKTHNLDQLRLKEGYTPLEFLAAFYEDRDPKQQEISPR